MKRLRDYIPWKKNKGAAAPQAETTFQSMPSREDDFWNLDFWNDRHSPWKMLHKSRLFPQVDVKEGKKKIHVEFEMPGVQAKDVDVSLDGRLLTVKGRKHYEKKNEDEGYYHYERAYGCYNRTVELPAEVDPVAVSASLKDGVLKVELKKTKASESRRIEVKTG